MKNILITGMSGTGKSTLINHLRSNGYQAADLDDAPYSIWADAEPDPDYPDNEVAPGKDWVWDETRVAALLSDHADQLLFVGGCASNMMKFYSYFDHIILLTAPDEIMVQRLQTRTGNPYGQQPEELSRVLRLKAEVELLLRSVADLEINTNTSPAAVIALILLHIQ